MIKKSLHEITIRDIYQLMNQKVVESRTLDYKLEVHVEDKFSNSRESRKELLRDLCAFANTDGGDLIIGVREENGSPSNIEGMETKNIDSLKLLIDNIIIDGIEPNIQYDIKTIPFKNGRFIIILRVYKNLMEGPYRVCYKNENKFYGRQSSRKYELDVSELRSKFNFTIKVQDEIEKIREKGIKKAYHTQHPIYFPHKSLMLLHLVPIMAFEKQVNLKEIKNLQNYFMPFYSGNKSFSKWNFDGYLSYNQTNGGDSYLQVYDNGVIEIVDGHFLNNHEQFPIDEIEKQLIHKLKNEYLIGIQKLGVQMPVFLYLTFINVKGYSVSDPMAEDKIKLDRKELKFPQIVIHDYKDIENIEQILNPTFERMWRSFGLSRGYGFYYLNGK